MTAALLLHRASGALPASAFRPAAFGPADPFAANRETAWAGSGGMSVGRMRFQGEADITHYPHTETLVVVNGELSLQVAGAPARVLRCGEGAVIARGTALRVMAVSLTTFVFCAAAADAPHPGGLQLLHASADFKPSSPPTADVLLGPTPQCRSDNVFTDEASQVRVGVWDSTPYHRIVRPHRVDEFMFLLSGSVYFEQPDGSTLEACSGDAVFVPQGTPVGWESREHVAKIYVVRDLPA